jgi:hypothetical protein
MPARHVREKPRSLVHDIPLQASCRATGMPEPGRKGKLIPPAFLPEPGNSSNAAALDGKCHRTELPPPIAEPLRVVAWLRLPETAGRSPDR